MSMAPNNPFEQPPQDPRYGDPYPARQGSNVWLWVLATIGAMFLIGTLVCCGVGYFIVSAGKDLIAEGAAQQLKDNPVIEEHIGIIEEIEMDFSELITVASEQDEDDDTLTFVFEVHGSKGSGKIHLRQDSADEEIESAELVMDDGTRYEIPVDSLNEGFAEAIHGEIETFPAEPVDTDAQAEDAEPLPSQPSESAEP